MAPADTRLESPESRGRDLGNIASYFSTNEDNIELVRTVAKWKELSKIYKPRSHLSLIEVEVGR